jgi:type IV secretory pathway ATPase VirB11/archaellum biosynthesis ATPase
MRFKKQPRKFTKSCSNQLVLDFESSGEIIVNIHTPKHKTISSSKNSLEKQRFIIRLCES